MASSLSISIYGMGYVGLVSACCLSRQGHKVTGIEINSDKLHHLNNGICPIDEPGLEDIMLSGLKSGCLQFSATAVDGSNAANISMVCVGTPSTHNGSTDISAVISVCMQIAETFGNNEGFHLIIIRSTIPPGTCEKHLIPAIEDKCGKQVGDGWSICANPEFLREGSAIADFNNPPKIVFGILDDNALVRSILESLYISVEAPIFYLPISASELTKMLDNTWHALKVAFANEISSLCQALQLSSHVVFEPFLQDTQLNISSRYLRPGFAFGGSCLPKDTRSMSYLLKSLDVHAPVTSSVIPSNQCHIQRAIACIENCLGSQALTFIGLTFKPGTDDFRESPFISLAEYFIGKGFDVYIVDQHIEKSALYGQNKQYLADHLKHFAQRLVPMTNVAAHLLDREGITVIGSVGRDYEGIIQNIRNSIVIDLPHLSMLESSLHSSNQIIRIN